jgi:hypothetical protein
MESVRSAINIEDPTLYDTDYLQWLETTVEKLRGQDFASVDWPHLVEEIEDMGRSERRRLESNLIVVLLHLLKWQYQPEQRSGSWEASLIEHRRRIRKSLQESPSLQPYLESIVAEAYTEAVKQARAETGLALTVFPEECPYGLTGIMEDEFLPG